MGAAESCQTQGLTLGSGTFSTGRWGLRGTSREGSEGVAREVGIEPGECSDAEGNEEVSREDLESQPRHAAKG